MGITTSHLVPAPRLEVWNWHARPGAVTRLTPPFLPMQVRAEASSLRDGTTVFSLPAGGTWVAQHQRAAYDFGHSFEDVAVNQPVRALSKWRHRHTFEDAPEGTLLIDAVSSLAPESWLTSAFAYRQRQLIADIHFAQSLPHSEPLTIALTGSSGLVGSHLRAQLTTLGHTVIPLVRHTAGPGERQWNPDDPDTDLLQGVDAVVHPAGESIMGRFTDGKKQRIWDSRITPTRKLARLAAASGVRIFVSASAIGFYGTNAGSRPHTEQDPVGDGFLAEVCDAWETAARVGAREGGGEMRTVQIRTGLVLSSAGGLLPVLKASVAAGLSARFGSGDFWMSWVALDDLTDIYIRAIHDEGVAGPVNATAAQPVTNAEMSATLADLLHRPDFMPIPTFGPKLLLGPEATHELAMADQRVIPATSTAHGWSQRYPRLREALTHELGKETLVG